MDFSGIIKRAWNITWRYKILWLFGLLSGGASGGGGNFNYSYGSGDFTPQQYDGFARLEDQLASSIPIILAVLVFFLIIGVGFWILSIAAQGGIVHLVNEAEESREVRASLGWGVGFARWGRVFLLQLVLFLPLMIVLLAMIAAVVVPIVIPLVNGNEPSGASILGMCGGIIFGMLLLFVIGFVSSILYNLALRYGVIDDVPAMASIGRAWGDFKSRFKDLFLMYLILIAVGFAYGIVVGVVGVVFGIAIGLAVAGGAFAVAGLIGFALFLLLLVPGAVYSTYVSSVWTLFFRALTGRSGEGSQPVSANGEPATMPPGAPSFVPPPPAAPGQYVPAPPAPPAPPAAPGPAAPTGPEAPDLRGPA